MNEFSSDIVNNTLVDSEDYDGDNDFEKAFPPQDIDPEARPLVFVSTFHEVICLLILTFTTAMNTASQAAMHIAVPTLAQYFQISGGDLSWTMSSFSLISGATILIFATIADKFGRRRMVVVSYTWFWMWSLIGSFSTHHIVFDISLGFQGLAAAACPSAAVGILGSVYKSGRRKNMVMAVFNAGAPFGAFFGTVTGGVCIQYLNWKSMFYILTILYTILMVLAFIFVPKDEFSDSESIDIKLFVKKIRELDLTGSFLVLVGCISFILALTQAGSAEKGWLAPHVLSILIGSLIIFAIFVWWESRVEQPIMPLHIWKFPGFALCMLIVFFGWMGFTGVLNFYAALWLQNIRGSSPILTTIYLIPQTFASIFSVTFIAKTMHIVPGRFILIIAQLCNVVASILWALQPIDIAYWAMTFPAVCLSVIAADFTFNVVNLHTLSTVPRQSQSTAAGTFFTFSHLAGSVGVSCSSTIVYGILSKSTESKNLAPNMISKIALAKAYHGAFWFAVGCSSIALLCSLFVKVGTQGSDRDKLADMDKLATGDGFSSFTEKRVTASLFEADDDAEECTNLLDQGDVVVCYRSLD
ncbi:major facilitator superfamily domain-containing protein [Dipodascopsis uninucleata]